MSLHCENLPASDEIIVKVKRVTFFETQCIYLVEHGAVVVGLFAQFAEQVLGWNQYLGVLFHELGEVVEQTVLRSEEVKLVVACLQLHQLGQELSTVPRDKLRRQLHHVQVKRRDRRRVRDELKLRRRLQRGLNLNTHNRFTAVCLGLPG